MLASLADPADVADIWRPLSPDEESQADGLIVKASALLRKAAPFDVDARIALDPADPLALDASVVATVVAGIVKRVMVNPDGVASSSESTGPFSRSATYVGQHDTAGTTETRGGLVVTDADLAALRPTSGYTAPRTIRTRACW